MITADRSTLRLSFLLVLGSLLAAYLCFWLSPYVFHTWNNQAVDRLFVIRSSSPKLRLPYDNTVALVDLNNTTIKRLQNLYLNRSHFARVIQNLASMGVSAQVYDFLFAAQLDQASDRVLIEATKQAGHVYFGLAVELREQGRHPPGEAKYSKEKSLLDQAKWQVEVEGDASKFYMGTNPLPTFPELSRRARGLGVLSVKFDRDGVLRRVPLLVRYQEAFLPLLPFRVICDYLGVSPQRIVVKPGKHIILKGARRPGENTPHNIAIPIDPQGNMIINYIGPWGRMDHYNFADIFLASDDRTEMELWKKELGGRILVISDVSTGSSDVGPVPVDANFPLSGAHANIIHAILTESFLRELSPWEALGVELVLMAVVLVLSLRFSSLYFSLGSFVVAGSYVGIVSVAFFYGNLIFPVVRPLLMVAFAVLAMAVHGYVREQREKMESLRQRDFVRETFGRYLSNEVVEELLGSPEGLEMRGEIREVTFLVADLRGFTALSWRLSPHQVVTILNRYLETMLDIIAGYRGTVNEIEGDGILAFFGAPLIGSDDPERAVACAIEMQNAMAQVNAQNRRLGLPEIAMGIGINSGEVIVGNIGSEKRAKYSAIGTPINTAYRIESFTVGGQILISSYTYEKVQRLVRVRKTMEVQFKGLDHPLILYDVVDMKGKYQLSLQGETTPQYTQLSTPVPITCFPIVDNKTISNASISGHITHLGKTTARAALARQVEMYANLKILLVDPQIRELPEIYAKVMAVEHVGGQVWVRLEFTSLAEDTRKYLQQKCLAVQG